MPHARPGGPAARCHAGWPACLPARSPQMPAWMDEACAVVHRRWAHASYAVGEEPAKRQRQWRRWQRRQRRRQWHTTTWLTWRAVQLVVGSLNCVASIRRAAQRRPASWGRLSVGSPAGPLATCDNCSGKCPGALGWQMRRRGWCSPAAWDVLCGQQQAFDGLFCGGYHCASDRCHGS